MDLLSAIYHYCNYQERSHYEVRNKLYELGARKTEVEQTIATLIEKDLLNEERFAKAIARGKFRMMQWGKVKIKAQLKQHYISEYCIRKAMKEIDDREYEETLSNLAARKWKELRSEKTQPVKKNKTFRYLLQKGYEPDLINDTINRLINPADSI